MSDSSVSFIDICSFVAPHLQNRSLKSLGCTCKSAQNIAKTILKDRDEHLERQFASFTCVKTFNVASWKEARIYFLGEQHTELYKVFEKNIITSLEQQGHVIVVLESLPALQECRKKDLDKLNSFNHTIDLIAEHLDLSENIHYIGWDDAQSIEEIMQEQMHLEEPFFKPIQACALELNNKYSQMNALRNQDKLLFRRLLRITSEIPNLKQIDEFKNRDVYMEYLQNILIEKTEFDEKQELAEVINQFFNLQKKLKQTMKHYHVLMRQQRELKHSWNDAIENLSKKITQILGRTFPRRVHAMVNTLANIEKYVQNLQCTEDIKVVVIAGSAHFFVPKRYMNDKDHDLNLFYQAAQKHKSALFILTERIDHYIMPS